MNRGVFITLALLSVISYIVEMCMGYSNSLESPWIFIWFERLVAFALSLELGIRFFKGDYKQKIWGKPLLIIDILSVLPFFLGFFIPSTLLGWVRSLRILRTLKMLRYSRSLQLVYLSFYRAGKQIKPILIAWCMVVVFFSVNIFQLERNEQKEFDNGLNCVYFSFVTASTIGYGDMTPKTKAGKVTTSLAGGLSLLLFAGMVGVVGNSILTVMKEEEDVTVDPLK